MRLPVATAIRARKKRGAGLCFGLADQANVTVGEGCGDAPAIFLRGEAWGGNGEPMFPKIPGVIEGSLVDVARPSVTANEHV